MFQEGDIGLYNIISFKHKCIKYIHFLAFLNCFAQVTDAAICKGTVYMYIYFLISNE